MNPAPRLLFPLLALALAAMHSGCSDAVLIQVENRPENTRALRLRATLDGVAIHKVPHDPHPLLLSPPPSRIVLETLPAPQGELDVTLDALVDECIVARGTARARIQLPSLDWSVVSVQLEPLTPKLCPVTVELHGATAGVSLAATAQDPWDCSPEVTGYHRCTAYFPVGQTASIDLQGLPDKTFVHRSYPSTLGSAAPPFALPVNEVTAPEQKAQDGGPENRLVLRLLNTTLDPGYTIKGLWGTPVTQSQDQTSWQYERLWAVGQRDYTEAGSLKKGGFIAELGHDGTLHVTDKPSFPLNAIMGRSIPVDTRSTQEIWTVGEAGTVLRWNGSTWQDLSLQPRPPQAEQPNLNALFVFAGSGDTWIVGNGGTVLRSRDGREPLSLVSSNFIPDDNLFAVAGAEQGGLLVIGRRRPGAHAEAFFRIDRERVVFLGLYPSTWPIDSAIALDSTLYLNRFLEIAACRDSTACNIIYHKTEKTSIWGAKPSRLWLGGSSLQYADVSQEPVVFRPVQLTGRDRDSWGSIVTGYAIANTPFSQDIWISDGTRLALVAGP